MHGQNVVTNEFRDPEGRLLVNDLFYTIQGEGPDAGRTAVFLRLAKCNLRCYFCDTEFEKGYPRAYRDLASSILHITSKSKCHLVVITGGEPLLQNVVPLIRELNAHNVCVSIETAGTVWCDTFTKFAKGRAWNKIVVSPKTPKIAREIIPFVAAFKYIIKVGDIDERDGLPIGSTQIKGDATRVPLYRPAYGTTPIYLQPMDEGDAERNQANAELAAQMCLRFGYRLSLQMHKAVGLP